MRKNIFELLNQKLDLINEYSKLYKMFKSEIIYEYENGFGSLTLYNYFDLILNEWKYRGTCENLEEILKRLSLINVTFESKALNDILLLIELIKNAEHICDKDNEECIKCDSLLISNIDIILNELGYTVVQRDEDSVQLIKKDADTLATALEVDDISLSRSILNYMDFRIEDDLDSKKDIIKRLADYLEPERALLKQLNSSLEDQIFYNLNNIHLRHNNQKGKNKKEYVANMSKEELLSWYDKTYSLILTAIRLIEFNKNKQEYQDLKKNIG